MSAQPTLAPNTSSLDQPLSWDELCADPRFQDLPYKIETTAQGQIIMSPHKRVHSWYQSRITKLLEEHGPAGGIATIEYAIRTSDGIKTVDVVWMPMEKALRSLEPDALGIAPDICVEVVSEANSRGALLNKAELYFQAGAREVWLCDNGTMEFLPGPSKLAPTFPLKIRPF